MYATTVCVQNTYLLLCTSVSIAIGLVYYAYEEQPPQFNCSELISALLTNDMDSHKIRGTRPLPVSQNSTSVQFDSLKADDKDCWKLKGSMHSYFRLDDCG